MVLVADYDCKSVICKCYAFSLNPFSPNLLVVVSVAPQVSLRRYRSSQHLLTVSKADRLHRKSGKAVALKIHCKQTALNSRCYTRKPFVAMHRVINASSHFR